MTSLLSIVYYNIVITKIVHHMSPVAIAAMVYTCGYIVPNAIDCWEYNYKEYINDVGLDIIECTMLQ